MIIESGSINRRTAGSPPEAVGYELRFVDESSLDEIMGLQDVISRNLPDEEMFRLDSKDYFQEHFRRERAVMAAFADGRMIAYHVISFPGEDGDNFGADIGTPKSDLEKVAHLETMAVDPEYRGNSLQRKMIGHHLKVIESLGFDHVCCTVSPKNHASMLNLFASGLVIKGLKLKFGGLLRYIMHLDLNYPFETGIERIKINSQDIQLQLEMLSKGFVGFEAEGKTDVFDVIYGRDLSSGRTKR